MHTKRFIVGTFLVAAVLLPAAIHAATLSEIIDLFISLNIIPQERAQQARAVLADTTGVREAGTMSSTLCPHLLRTITTGARGNDVSELQKFLASTGDYTYSGYTGYFGPVTAQAVANFQIRTGIILTAGASGAGVVGPKTRGEIAKYCGSTQGPEHTPGNVSACTLQYQPVCGRPTGCANTCPPGQVCTLECRLHDPQTYGNRCQLDAAGAAYLYEGQCTQNPVDMPPAQCKIWYDGCNTCSRSYPGGALACTKRACIWQAPTYCEQYFDSSTNSTPSITSFSGPSQLNTHETGTWSITAQDQEHDQLTYDIIWGDEVYTAAALSGAYARQFSQTTTLTHSYSNPGTYTVRIVVRDTSGQSSQATASVIVTDGYGSLRVCAHDAFCMCDATGRVVLCQ